jgi:hypothetical protein
MRGRGSGDNGGFIREVDEAVRQDRWLQLGKRYGAYVLAAALAIVLGTGAGVAWRNWQESQRADEARRYAAAEALLREDRASEAAAAFHALAEDADGGYGVVARLRAAEAEAAAGESAAAAATLDGLGTSGAAKPVYRQLGDLLTLQREFDQADPDSVAGRVAILTAPDAPWRHSALELEALAQLRAGDLDSARRTLETLLADPRTPANLSRRAAELMAAIGGPAEPDAANEAGEVTGDAAGEVGETGDTAGEDVGKTAEDAP